MRNPTEIGRDLATWKRKRQLTESYIAHATSISQPWVSRILNGKFKRLTPAVQRLCEYADIDIEYQVVRSVKGFARLSNALDAVWDGTDVDARRIEKLLRAVSQIRNRR